MDTHKIINWFHVLVVAPFLLYVANRREKCPGWVFMLMLVVGAIVVGFHFYKAVGNGFRWVNVIHFALVGPLVFYIGLRAAATPRKYFELLLLFAFAALGYHSWYLVTA